MRIDRVTLAATMAKRCVRGKELAMLAGISVSSVSGIRNGRSCSSEIVWSRRLSSNKKRHSKSVFGAALSAAHTLLGTACGIEPPSVQAPAVRGRPAYSHALTNNPPDCLPPPRKRGGRAFEPRQPQ